ncbi:SDR family oxidoreductase [Halobacteriaceae archaeon GCM10025711]
MTTMFLTGFPGFLGSALVERLLDRTPDDVTVTCLVQAKYRDRAERRAERIARTVGTDTDRVHLVEGDITRSDLGLGDDYADLQRETREVYHLAAVYDLGVSREVGYRVNVEGTRNVLDFADGSPDLDRFQYVSTAYVSGRYDGTFTEDHLREGQRFNNHYESTKYTAEVDVQRRMQEGLPATIYRPAIAVGDSETGATQKYDGPYYVMQWLLRQPSVGVVPTVADPDTHTVNVVPRDYVVDAIAHLSGIEASEGRVYNLCDPSPPTVAELLELLGDATDTRVATVPLPKSLAKRALRDVPGVQRLLRIEPATIDYFDHPTEYDCENAMADLAGTGIEPPPFESYVDTLVAFMREHPEISPDAMT